MGLHNKKQDRIGASVFCLAHETYTAITSSSSAGARDWQTHRENPATLPLPAHFPKPSLPKYKAKVRIHTTVPTKPQDVYGLVILPIPTAHPHLIPTGTCT